MGLLLDVLQTLFASTITSHQFVLISELDSVDYMHMQMREKNFFQFFFGLVRYLVYMALTRSRFTFNAVSCILILDPNKKPGSKCLYAVLFLCFFFRLFLINLFSRS